MTESIALIFCKYGRLSLTCLEKKKRSNLCLISLSGETCHGDEEPDLKGAALFPSLAYHDFSYVHFLPDLFDIRVLLFLHPIFFITLCQRFEGSSAGRWSLVCQAVTTIFVSLAGFV